MTGGIEAGRALIKAQRAGIRNRRGSTLANGVVTEYDPLRQVAKIDTDDGGSVSAQSLVGPLVVGERVKVGYELPRGVTVIGRAPTGADRSPEGAGRSGFSVVIGQEGFHTEDEVDFLAPEDGVDAGPVFEAAGVRAEELSPQSFEVCAIRVLNGNYYLPNGAYMGGDCTLIMEPSSTLYGGTGGNATLRADFLLTVIGVFWGYSDYCVVGADSAPCLEAQKVDIDSIWLVSGDGTYPVIDAGVEAYRCQIWADERSDIIASGGVYSDCYLFGNFDNVPNLRDHCEWEGGLIAGSIGAFDWSDSEIGATVVMAAGFANNIHVKNCDWSPGPGESVTRRLLEASTADTTNPRMMIEGCRLSGSIRQTAVDEIRWYIQNNTWWTFGGGPVPAVEISPDSIPGVVKDNLFLEEATGVVVASGTRVLVQGNVFDTAAGPDVTVGAAAVDTTVRGNTGRDTGHTAFVSDSGTGTVID